MKNRGIAIVLAIFFGGLGVHRFYVGQVGRGFLFLLFCWTGIPSFLALVDIVRWVLMGNKKFEKKYNL